jgi:hypothetical protein
VRGERKSASHASARDRLKMRRTRRALQNASGFKEPDLKIYYVQPRKQYDYLCRTVVAAFNMSLASSITVPVDRLGGQTGASGSRHFEQNTRAMALPVFLSLSLSLAIVAIQFTSLQSALGSGSGRLQGSTLLLRLYSESSPFTNHYY